MEKQLSIPDPDDPIWTAERGILVRHDEGVPKHFAGGREASRVKLTADRTGGRLSFLDFDIAPGFGNNAHAHRSQDEAFFVRSGTFRFINGSSFVDAGPGDFLYVPQGTRHGFKNLGTEVGSLLVFFTPGGPEQFFLDHGDDPDPSGRPTPEWPRERLLRLADDLDANGVVLLPSGDDDWA